MMADLSSSMNCFWMKHMQATATAKGKPESLKFIFKAIVNAGFSHNFRAPYLDTTKFIIVKRFQKLCIYARQGFLKNCFIFLLLQLELISPAEKIVSCRKRIGVMRFRLTLWVFVVYIHFYSQRFFSSSSSFAPPPCTQSVSRLCVNLFDITNHLRVRCLVSQRLHQPFFVYSMQLRSAVPSGQKERFLGVSNGRKSP